MWINSKRHLNKTTKFRKIFIPASDILKVTDFVLL